MRRIDTLAQLKLSRSAQLEHLALLLFQTLNMNKPLFAQTAAFLAAAILCMPTAKAQTAMPTEFPAQLAGHALIPAPSFIATPADAPADLRFSGKFTTGARVERLDTAEGRSANRPTGISLLHD